MSDVIKNRERILDSYSYLLPPPLPLLVPTYSTLTLSSFLYEGEEGKGQCEAWGQRGQGGGGGTLHREQCIAVLHPP